MLNDYVGYNVDMARQEEITSLIAKFGDQTDPRIFPPLCREEKIGKERRIDMLTIALVILGLLAIIFIAGVTLFMVTAGLPIILVGMLIVVDVVIVVSIIKAIFGHKNK